MSETWNSNHLIHEPCSPCVKKPSAHLLFFWVFCRVKRTLNLSCLDITAQQKIAGTSGSEARTHNGEGWVMANVRFVRLTTTSVVTKCCFRFMSIKKFLFFAYALETIFFHGKIWTVSSKLGILTFCHRQAVLA